MDRRPVFDTGLGFYSLLPVQESLTPCQARGDGAIKVDRNYPRTAFATASSKPFANFASFLSKKA
jgi:hypothetical protein